MMKSSRVLLSALSCLFAIFMHPCFSQNFIPTQNYIREEYLNEDHSVQLFWTFNNEDITFEVHARTNGWIGLGISPNGGMKNADIWIGWVKDGRAKMTDRRGPSWGNFVPPLDYKQDLELIDGRECGGKTMLKFKRKLHTCDEEDQPVAEGTIKLIAAFGQQDPGDGVLSLYDIHQHENKWTKTLILLSGSSRPARTFTGNTSSFDLRNNRSGIRTDYTYYNCLILKLPHFPAKEHIIKIEPLIQREFVDEVHHMILSLCSRPPKNPNDVGRNFNCLNDSNPPDRTSCTQFVAAWGVGQTAFTFPNDVGFPIGGRHSPEYILLETHYDNPQLKDIRDSSGFRVIHTSDLRSQESGVLFIAHQVSGVTHVIPPRTASFMTYAECGSTCLSSAMENANVNEVKVFGVFYHSHLTGRGMMLQHLRNGKELKPIARDDHYDVKFQEIRLLREEQVVKKGDSIILRCESSTLDRSYATVGGGGTEDAMYISALFYYPAIPLRMCGSAPLAEDILKEMTGIKVVKPINSHPLFFIESLYDLIVTSPETLANLHMSDVIADYPWNEKTSKDLSDRLRKSKLSKLCRGPQPLLPVRSVGNPEKFDKPYEEPIKNCIAASKSHVSVTAAADCVKTIGQLPFR